MARGLTNVRSGFLTGGSDATSGSESTGGSETTGGSKERTIDNWRLSLPSLEISPAYSRGAGPEEKYQKDSCRSLVPNLIGDSDAYGDGPPPCGRITSSETGVSLVPSAGFTETG